MKHYPSEFAGRRVKMPVWTDAWMMGDRFGQIVRTYKARKNIIVAGGYTVAVVRLDISRHTVRMKLDDLEFIS